MSKVLAVLKVKERGIARYSYHKIDSFPCSVGRSFENDIILLNAGISREHATINMIDGKIIIEDSGCTNGISLNGKKVKKAEFKKKADILIGSLNAELLIEEDHEKTVVKKMRLFHFRKHTMKTLLIDTALHSFILYLILLLSSWMEDPFEKKDMITVFWDMISKVFMASYIAGSLGIIGKIQVKKYLFKPIFSFVLRAIVIFSAIDIFYPYLLFNINDRVAEDLLRIIIYGVFTLYTLYGLGRRFFPYSTVKKIFISIISATAGLILLGIVSKSMTSNDTGYDFSVSYSYPFFSYDKDENGVAKLFEKMDESFKEVDEKRIEELEKKKELSE